MKKIVAGIIIGSALTFSTTVFADSIQKFILTKVSYPVIVKGKEYKNTDLPVLNYQGNTYVPLKAVGDVLGASVTWNQQLKRVEIGNENLNAVEAPDKSSTQFEILTDYLPNEVLPAIKYYGTIYLPAKGGVNKYGLNLIWHEDTRIYSFDKTNVQVKMSSEMAKDADGFVYKGSSYIKESLFIQASKELHIQFANETEQIETEYPKFKSLFNMETKKLSSDNIVSVLTKHYGSDDQDIEEFFNYWNSLGVLKGGLLEKYAVEVQKLNPQYPLDISFIYDGKVYHLLARVNVNRDGTIKQINISEIANPNPDQSSIK